ncbi:MAG: hypothetical protein HC866_12410 [Leptolyngbyaceae cyanobacterium RU_5_1]|nr:hypothetical protein [Leptolyngbyaceae cyanobacterium RU_5_1]
MNFGVLPLRAIAFQGLFLLLAIALEAIIFSRQLGLDYKTSVRYSASVNLFSTLIGWLVFFNAQVLMPEELRIQLISYFFFERFFPNPWSSSVAPILAVSGLAIFMGVFFAELKGLDFLEILLEKRKADDTTVAAPRVQRFRRLSRGISFKTSSRAFAVLAANALSFSAILFLLFIRWLEQAL